MYTKWAILFSHEACIPTALPNYSSKAALIHYIGDENVAVNFHHGNSVNHLARPHIRTCPSVLRSLEKECNAMGFSNVFVTVYGTFMICCC